MKMGPEETGDIGSTTKPPYVENDTSDTSRESFTQDVSHEWTPQKFKDALDAFDIPQADPDRFKPTDKQKKTGGEAEVYIAYDTRLNREVALKIQKAKQNVTAEDTAINSLKLLAEAGAHGGAEHPNIANLYEVTYFYDEDNPESFPEVALVMESMDKPGYMRVKEALQSPDYQINMDHIEAAVHGVCDAVDYIRDENIGTNGIEYFRDLKPENMFFIKDANGNVYIKITDFGISKSVVEDARFEQYKDFGTINYIPPERMRDVPYDEFKAEMFSAAMSFYELTTGEKYRTAFSGTDQEKYQAMMEQNGLSEIQKTKVSSKLLEKGMDPGKIGNFIDALDIALKNKPSDREFSSMREFSNALLSENRPVESAQSYAGVDTTDASPNKRLQEVSVGGNPNSPIDRSPENVIQNPLPRNQG